ncbi:MAG TPA: hypothetical protein VHK69_21820, partial [Chitinophagaceae bacterium]|nr:hypothetical protein [Chitinophagaceae bacterium]
MLRKPYLLLLFLVGTGFGFFTLSGDDPTETKPWLPEIIRLYRSDLRRLDAALERFPKLVYDSSYAARLAGYEALACQIKRVEGFFAYLHPKQAYDGFLKTAQFEARDFGPPLPDNWLILGPFGIEHDSVLRRKKGADSAFTKKFIERSVNRFRKELQELNLATEGAALTEATVFEALRLELARISTIGLGNGDLVIQQAALPAL